MNATRMIATVIAAAAKLSISIRLRATPGSPRPARQRRTATTIESSVQWMTNAATHAVSHVGLASPSSGRPGRTTVHRTSNVVAESTMRARRREGGSKATVKR
jgi:hypothetical protein